MGGFYSSKGWVARGGRGGRGWLRVGVLAGGLAFGGGGDEAEDLEGPEGEAGDEEALGIAAGVGRGEEEAVVGEEGIAKARSRVVRPSRISSSRKVRRTQMPSPRGRA